MNDWEMGSSWSEKSDLKISNHICSLITGTGAFQYYVFLRRDRGFACREFSVSWENGISFLYFGLIASCTGRFRRNDYLCISSCDCYAAVCHILHMVCDDSGSILQHTGHTVRKSKGKNQCRLVRVAYVRLFFLQIFWIPSMMILKSFPVLKHFQSMMP